VEGGGRGGGRGTSYDESLALLAQSLAGKGSGTDDDLANRGFKNLKKGRTWDKEKRMRPKVKDIQDWERPSYNKNRE